MVRWAVIIACVVAATALGGCLDPYRAVVDADVLSASPRAWDETRLDERSNGWLGPNVVETEYRYDPPSDEAQTPGVLIVVGIRTINQIDSADLLERTRAIVDQELADEGVIVDQAQEQTGERETEQGIPTQWFSLVGAAHTDAPIFAGEEEVRALGETWYDGRSKTHIVVVALAQTTTTGFLGSEARDHSVWNELVGDAAGSVGGAMNDNGFIVNILSHG